MSVPFVGRQRELAEITALLRQSSHARAPRAVLVTGEPGSGKTRLLEEVLAGPRIARVVRVVGFEPNQAVPLAAVGEVIRQLSTVPGHGSSLEQLVFGGSDHVSRAPLRIFEAAYRALSAHGPLLIGVDDLQWVDDQSLGMIHYLLRAAEPARQPLSVVAVARPSPAATAFRSTVEGGLTADRRVMLDLGPLPLEDGLALARAIDASLSEAAAATLWRRARGSPFWLDALTRAGGDVEPSGLIAERLQALTGESGGLLALLAVGARPFMVDEIAELLEWNVSRVRHASAELVARGLGIEVSGTIRLAHDLIREAAAASLPVRARRRLHARLADWIATTAGDDVKLLREALDHRVLAAESTAELALRLISSPGRRLLNGDDLRLLASISDGLDPGATARVRIDRALGELGAIIGELELAVERWTRVSNEAADALEACHAETEAARAAYRLGRRAEAHEHLDRARALPTAELEAIVRLDALQADVELWLDHETTAGSRTAQRAVVAAEEMASRSGGLEALSPAARRAYLAAVVSAIDGAMQEDRDDDLIRLADQCLRIATTLDDESRIAAETRVGQAFRTAARPREGEARGRHAWEASKRLVLPLLTVEAGQRLARALRDLGRLAEAHAVAVETRELEARLTNAPRHWGGGASIRHVIELSFADAAEALRALRRDAAEEPDPHYSQDLHLAIAVWQARVSGAKAATEVDAELRAAHADAAMARCPRHSNGLALSTAELLARTGRVDEARRALAEWDLRPGTSRMSRELWRMRTAAAIEAADGDNEAASATLEAYAMALERAGLNLELLWARIDLGRCLATLDRGRAVAAYTAAAQLAAACAAVSEGRLVSQALRQLGVRAWRRGAATATAGLIGLSRREQEIANRVADGASNREIGEALVVSPKTVERHVTNILAKLGLRNRTELASLVRSAVVRGSPDD
ncbi:MAG TPA: AAA family ATPase [Candidatus Sulfomarinibacteraceae bacterium]|nr:AAA family ATPase [Candidatus Sulfomarinibacteraceae bacterium]